MPRQARLILPDMPHHILQRGHNSQMVFSSDEDFLYYKRNLLKFKEEFGCKIYAYCLMGNHVHLVVNPGQNTESLSLLMKRVAGRQTRHINKLTKRSGSLWEGRFKSSVISSREYLLACCRYIELNPLRAAIVNDPGDYPWSSYICKANGITDKIVDLPHHYKALGNTKEERQIAYREYISQSIPKEEMQCIRKAVHRNQLTGSSKFYKLVEKKYGIYVSDRGPGRPKKSK